MAERSEIVRSLRRWVLYPIQGAVVWSFCMLLRVMPIELSSWIGSLAFRTFGPMLKSDRIARRNLKMVYPEKPKQEIDKIVSGMWANLGRGAGEWSQIDLIETTGPNSRVTIEGLENLQPLLDAGKPFIVFSGHLANWEMASLVPAQMGIPLVNIYRSASVPIVDRLMRDIRGRFTKRLIPKGRNNAREILEALKNGDPLGLLTDQKLNEGQAIPFLGYDAMTATAPAELALRFKVPLIPARVYRMPNIKFHVKVYPQIAVPDTDDRAEAVTIMTRKMNDYLSEWIHETPEQWFWVHRRWPADPVKSDPAQ